ncbi:MAG: nickel-responsive transcriptional regulator NikR [Planctomycetes bacterium]|nr:nickel-responsive transcriptional regulator NikR [Planctomycetota bacterium]
MAQSSAQKTQRIGISLEDDLLSQFDDLITKGGYTNRSEAIRDLIREKLTAQKLKAPETTAIAAIFVVYDHHQAKLAQKLIQLQHSHIIHAISSIHIHITHHNCLEVILLKGKVKEIQKLADSILSLKGVKLGKVNLIAAED